RIEDDQVDSAFRSHCQNPGSQRFDVRKCRPTRERPRQDCGLVSEMKPASTVGPEVVLLLGDDNRKSRRDRLAQEVTAVTHACQQVSKKGRLAGFPKAGEQSQLARREQTVPKPAILRDGVLSKVEKSFEREIG